MTADEVESGKPDPPGIYAPRALLGVDPAHQRRARGRAGGSRRGSRGRDDRHRRADDELRIGPPEGAQPCAGSQGPAAGRGIGRGWGVLTSTSSRSREARASTDEQPRRRRSDAASTARRYGPARGATVSGCALDATHFGWSPSIPPGIEARSRVSASLALGPSGDSELSSYLTLRNSGPTMWPKWPGSSWPTSCVACAPYQTTTSVFAIDSPLTKFPMFAS